jgi:hypothetical protein
MAPFWHKCSESLHSVVTDRASSWLTAPSPRSVLHQDWWRAWQKTIRRRVRNSHLTMHPRASNSSVERFRANLPKRPGLRREEAQFWANGKEPSRTAHPKLFEFPTRIGTLLQSNRLNDVSREKEIDRPVHEHSNFAFPTGQFRKVDSPPEEPSEQTRKAQESAPSKRNAQFRTGCLVPHYAERTERIEMKLACRPTFQLHVDVACKNFRLTQRKLSRWRARASGRCIGHRGAVADCPQAETARQRNLSGRLQDVASFDG